MQADWCKQGGQPGPRAQPGPLEDTNKKILAQYLWWVKAASSPTHELAVSVSVQPNSGSAL